MSGRSVMNWSLLPVLIPEATGAAFGCVVRLAREEVLGLPRSVPRHPTKALFGPRTGPAQRPPAWVRRALEEMGPTSFNCSPKTWVRRSSRRGSTFSKEDACAS